MTATQASAAGWVVYCRCGWRADSATSTQESARATGDAHLNETNGATA